VRSRRDRLHAPNQRAGHPARHPCSHDVGSEHVSDPDAHRNRNRDPDTDHDRNGDPDRNRDADDDPDADHDRNGDPDRNRDADHGRDGDPGALRGYRVRAGRERGQAGPCVWRRIRPGNEHRDARN
jgi:hypothetical protein